MDTETILSWNMPQKPPAKKGITGGPFSVVARGENCRGDQWFLVALEWGDEHGEQANVLAIRWETFPRNYTWLVLPRDLWAGILAGLDLPNEYRAQISAFLFAGEPACNLPEEPERKTA